MKKRNLIFRFPKYSFSRNGNAANVESVSYFRMFRYATLSDKLLMSVGLICCTIGGVIRPLNFILVGDLINGYVTFAVFTNSVNNSTTLEQKREAEEAFFNGIFFYCKGLALFGLTIIVLCYASVAIFSYSSLRQIFRIRSEYLRAMLNQDISWYDSEKNDDFASRMSNDIYKLEDGLGEKVPMFFGMQVSLISCIIISFIKGWELALVALIPILLILCVNLLVNWVTIKLAANEMQAYGAAGSIADEVFTLIKTVTAFGGQQKEIDRYKKSVVAARENNIKRSIFSGVGAGSVHLLIFISEALVFWYGVHLIEDNDIPNSGYTIKNVITILYSSLHGAVTIGQIAPYIETFGLAKSAATNIFRIIDDEPIINLPNLNLNSSISFKGNIEFKNVKFHYPSRPGVTVLKDINFKIKVGDKVAIVGSSGCGKSTIIQLIQRFYDTTSGEILIDGNNIKELNLKWLRSNIGVVGQEPILFSTSVIENIRYGKDGVTDDEVIAAAKKANAHNFIQSLPNGYNTLVGERGTQLSGGQKQRIAIARALIRKPVLLLLDEATSALDNTSEAKVQAALDVASANCTTIIVAHRLSTICSANKIIVLSQGVVVEEGTHYELMELKNEYYRLITAQLPSIEIMQNSDKEIKDWANNNDKDINLNNNSKQDMTEDDDFETNIDVTMFDVLKMNAPEWRFLLVANIASIVLGCGLPTFSVLYGSILGQLATTDTEYLFSEVNRYCAYFVIIGVILMIAASLQFYFLGIAGERMTERIRTRLFQAILAQDMSFFDKRSNGVGVLCAKLSADATSIQGATGQRIGTILTALSTAAVALGISLYYEWRLALVAASFTPFLIGSVFLNKRFATKAKKNNSLEDAIQNSTKIALEALLNIRTVAALGIEDKFHQSYVSQLEPSYKTALNSIHWRSFVYGLSISMTLFGYSATIYYGAILIAGGLPYNRVIQIAQCQMMGSNFIANALAFCPNLTNGLTAAKKVKSFLSKTNEIKNVFASNDVTQVKGSLNYSNIQFEYPTRPDVSVLRGLNLKIPNGKSIALVGESGCGKSTIIQLIEKFYDPTSGDIYLDNNNIQNIPPLVLRSHLSIVSQEPNLFNKTISENIAYGDNSRDVPMTEIIQAAKSANIHDFITGLPQGYDTKLGEKSTQLSGGQKQRIAIARALVRNPKVLLLDEATSALDSESEKIVQEALDTAKKGRTCITIAHRLTTIQDADLICVVDKGIIVESGTHKELLKKAGFYYRLYSQNSSSN